jgi:hypothetical protein
MGHGTGDRGEKCTRFLWGSPKERDHSEDQGVDGSMGSEWILGRLANGVNWIRVAQVRDRWPAIVISRWIYIVIYKSIHIDQYRLITIDIYIYIYNNNNISGTTAL